MRQNFSKGFQYKWVLMLPLLFFFKGLVSAQIVQGDHLIVNAQDSLAFLLKKYIDLRGDPEQKITELIRLSRREGEKGNLLSAVQKVHVALLLKNEVDTPCFATFHLHEYAGDLFRNYNGRLATRHYLTALSHLTYVENVPNDKKFTVLTRLAGTYQSINEMDSARYYYHLATVASKLDSPTAEASSVNNLGIFFFEIGHNDSARIYFKKALTMIGPIENEVGLYCAVLDNIAQLDMREGQLGKAIKAWQFNDSVYFAGGFKYNYIANKVRLFKAQLITGDDGLDDDIVSFQKYLDQNRKSALPADMLEFYKFANEYYFRENQRDKQSYYLKKYIQFNDSLDLRALLLASQVSQSMLSLQEATFESEINAHQLEVEQNRLKLHRTRLTAIIAVLAAILIISQLVWFIRKRKKEHLIAKKLAESELQRKEMEAMLIQKELELKKHDLTNVVLHNTQVYDANQKIIERLEGISHQKGEYEKHIHSLLVELQGQNQISDRSIGLQANIDSLNAEFYEKLKTRYPELTKAEAELCGYIRINLSTKDISILKNVATASVKMGKNRLRKKLGLGPDADLYQFVGTI